MHPIGAVDAMSADERGLARLHPVHGSPKEGRGPAHQLKLLSVEKRKGGRVWLRYKVKR
jgi:hypothetical protein